MSDQWGQQPSGPQGPYNQPQGPFNQPPQPPRPSDPYYGQPVQQPQGPYGQAPQPGPYGPAQPQGPYGMPPLEAITPQNPYGLPPNPFGDLSDPGRQPLGYAQPQRPKRLKSWKLPSKRVRRAPLTALIVLAVILILTKG